MSRVNMLEAKTHLSRLVDAAGKRLPKKRSSLPATASRRPGWCRLSTKPKKRRLGLANGMYPTMTQEEFNADDEKICALENSRFPG